MPRGNRANSSASRSNWKARTDRSARHPRHRASRGAVARRLEHLDPLVAPAVADQAQAQDQVQRQVVGMLARAGRRAAPARPGRRRRCPAGPSPAAAGPISGSGSTSYSRMPNRWASGTRPSLSSRAIAPSPPRARRGRDGWPRSRRPRPGRSGPAGSGPSPRRTAPAPSPWGARPDGAQVFERQVGKRRGRLGRDLPQQEVPGPVIAMRSEVALQQLPRSVELPLPRQVGDRVEARPRLLRAGRPARPPRPARSPAPARTAIRTTGRPLDDPAGSGLLMARSRLVTGGRSAAARIAPRPSSIIRIAGPCPSDSASPRCIEDPRSKIQESRTLDSPSRCFIPFQCALLNRSAPADQRA